MSAATSLTPLSDENDPIILNERLMSLRAEYERTKIFKVPEELTDQEEIDRLKAAHSDRVASMIREQISLLSRLRLTASGPARKGGKRAKKAPFDINNLLAD